MSLRSLIAKHGASYTVTRVVAGSHDADGKYTAGASSTFPIVAYIEPTIGRELEDLPEGQRGNEVRTVYTETELLAAARPDSIAIAGEAWSVIRVERFDGLGGSHFRARAARTATP